MGEDKGRDDPTLKQVTGLQQTNAAGRERQFVLQLERDVAPCLKVVSSDGRLSVGRSPEADLAIDCSTVSRMHCEVVAVDDGFVLRDLGSRNGTWLAGLRVREVLLPSEARIRVGATQLAFGVVDDAQPPSLHPEARFGRLIGESCVARAVFARLACVAARDTTVLLEGESGTGKELAAHAIHQASSRRDRPFVVVDCGSIPRTLLEAELFGHERGAYTGATHARQGAFVQANGGSLFLDEIGELDLELQPRLLRVLEQREVKPIGGSQPIQIDVRIIAASNRDLRREVKQGSFREDLYYRLAVACVRMPPLRERIGDIPMLVRSFLEEHSRRDGVSYALEEILPRLLSRPWPGNARELRNEVERIVAFGFEHAPPATAQAASIDLPFKIAKAHVVESFEREYLVALLARHAGNITASASAAEVDRVHFLRLLDRHDLRQSRRRGS